MKYFIALVALCMTVSCASKRHMASSHHQSIEPLNIAIDIKNTKMKLFCGLAFAPVANGKADIDFEKKYGINYYIVGDYLDYTEEEMKAYNLAIANSLDEKFGTAWRKECRKDVIGL